MKKDNQNDGYIGADYVDPNLLAQYDEPEPVVTPTNFQNVNQNPNANQTNYNQVPLDGDKLDNIFQEAINREASDIHLLAGCMPLLRVAKELVYIERIGVLSDEDMKAFIRKIADNDGRVLDLLAEQKLLDMNYKFNDIRFRVNISFSMDAPTITMRVIKSILPLYSSLNLPASIRDYTLKSQGLILVTGKPGSGKSTTLSALVNEINESQNKKVLMLENPIEFVHENKRSVIVQKEVGPFGDVKTYHQGVVNALREDCDVLIVGEIRDKVTMDATIEMAETGHLVLGTLHTNSCAETIDRIINFYPTEDQQTVKFMIANVLKLVLSQRMLRGSYGNLVMIPEVLIVDDQVGGMIKKDKFNNTEVEDAMHSGREKGNVSLVFSLADAVLQNKITMEQAQKEVDFKRQELLARLVAAGRQRRYLKNT